MRVNLRDEENRWYLFSGQSEECLNIRVYCNGATDDGPEEDIDEIHICDIDALIARLQEARAIRDSEPRSW